MILELRQYTLHAGTHEVLIELFERELLETQEAVGMQVIGQFRDLDDPDRFVWLRGFADTQARRAGLTAFYGGPIWAKHRDAANATIVDSDNVLLLRPARPTSGFQLPADREDGARGVLLASIGFFNAPLSVELVDDFVQHLVSDQAVLGVFVTEPSPNNFPALPVREGENVLVWFGRPRAREPPQHLARRLSRPLEVHKLAPTTRSRLQA